MTFFFASTASSPRKDYTTLIVLEIVIGTERK